MLVEKTLQQWIRTAGQYYSPRWRQRESTMHQPKGLVQDIAERYGGTQPLLIFFHSWRKSESPEPALRLSALTPPFHRNNKPKSVPADWRGERETHYISLSANSRVLGGGQLP